MSFDGGQVYLNLGSSFPRKKLQEIKNLITANGGVVSNTLHNKVACLVSTPEQLDSFTTRRAASKKVPVVSLDYITNLARRKKSLERLTMIVHSLIPVEDHVVDNAHNFMLEHIEQTVEDMLHTIAAVTSDDHLNNYFNYSGRATLNPLTEHFYKQIDIDVENALINGSMNIAGLFKELEFQSDSRGGLLDQLNSSIRNFYGAECEDIYGNTSYMVIDDVKENSDELYEPLKEVYYETWEQYDKMLTEREEKIKKINDKYKDSDFYCRDAFFKFTKDLLRKNQTLTELNLSGGDKMDSIYWKNLADAINLGEGRVKKLTLPVIDLNSGDISHFSVLVDKLHQLQLNGGYYEEVDGFYNVILNSSNLESFAHICKNREAYSDMNDFVHQYAKSSNTKLSRLVVDIHTKRIYKEFPKFLSSNRLHELEVHGIDIIDSLKLCSSNNYLKYLHINQLDEMWPEFPEKVNSNSDRGSFKIIGDILSKCLTTLKLEYAMLDNDTISLLGEELKNNEILQKLFIKNSSLKDLGIEILLDKISENKSIKYLSLAGNNISKKGMTTIAKYLSINSTLQTLSLNDNKIGSSRGCKELGIGIKLNNNILKSLKLRNNNIGRVGLLNHLDYYLKFSTSIHRLDLSDNNLDGYDIAKFLNSNKQINHLTIKDNKIDELNTDEDFFLTLSMSNLTYLDISGNCFYLNELFTILSVNEKLTHLDISRTNGTDYCEGISFALSNNTTLKYLNLSGNDIDSSGMLLISEALEKHNTTLQSLYLNGNDIGNEGVLHIGEILSKNSSLTSIGFSWSSDYLGEWVYRSPLNTPPYSPRNDYNYTYNNIIDAVDVIDDDDERDDVNYDDENNSNNNNDVEVEDESSIQQQHSKEEEKEEEEEGGGGYVAGDVVVDVDVVEDQNKEKNKRKKPLFEPRKYNYSSVEDKIKSKFTPTYKFKPRTPLFKSESSYWNTFSSTTTTSTSNEEDSNQNDSNEVIFDIRQTATSTSGSSTTKKTTSTSTSSTSSVPKPTTTIPQNKDNESEEEFLFVDLFDSDFGNVIQNSKQKPTTTRKRSSATKPTNTTTINPTATPSSSSTSKPNPTSTTTYSSSSNSSKWTADVEEEEDFSMFSFFDDDDDVPTTTKTTTKVTATTTTKTTPVPTKVEESSEEFEFFDLF
eukprot:TRINITY_DN458_c2_g4_i2.p1 TRINITY_DN458_c2_g4~~TRINITY_DN458_c2_g4_i2.p1  ORF type:complete len:1156 (-),score=283.84 TRINITY_DN458_c2_g4_i2:3154-6621(-)